MKDISCFCEFEISNDQVIAKLSGDIDYEYATDIKKAILEQLSKNNFSNLVLDFKGLTFIDSSMIGAIFGMYKFIEFFNGSIKIINAFETIFRLLKISGIDEMVSINED